MVLSGTSVVTWGGCSTPCAVNTYRVQVQLSNNCKLQTDCNVWFVFCRMSSYCDERCCDSCLGIGAGDCKRISEMSVQGRRTSSLVPVIPDKDRLQRIKNPCLSGVGVAAPPPQERGRLPPPPGWAQVHHPDSK